MLIQPRLPIPECSWNDQPRFQIRHGGVCPRHGNYSTWMSRSDPGTWRCQICTPPATPQDVFAFVGPTGRGFSGGVVFTK